MPSQCRASKTQACQRGSLTADDVVEGACELAQKVCLDDLSMTSLAEHLGVGTPSLYGHFRTKAELVPAMARHAVRTAALPTLHVAPGQWRHSLHRYAHRMRDALTRNPLVIDLVLIRKLTGSQDQLVGTAPHHQAVAALVEAGLSPADAARTLAVLTLHIHGSVVLELMHDWAEYGPVDALPPDEATNNNSPALLGRTSELAIAGRRVGVPDDDTFEFSLASILDGAQRLIEQRVHRTAASR